MPRKLPWKSGSSSTPIRPKRCLTSTGSAPKRQKEDTPISASGSDNLPASPKDERSEGRGPSTSPPPKPPLEEFMDDGLEKDDKYRMVEDEFLSIAQKFSVHLHAAEYKRQEKLAKSRNAQTISSISRPVIGKMPEQTKRKVQGLELAKTQKSALEGLLGKNSKASGISDDSGDDDGLPYVGTTLHGLMDSPRKKAALLAKFGSTAATTRSAAGFKKPITKLKKIKSESPLAKSSSRNAPSARPKADSSTESSDDDDDLDAPIIAPKLARVDAKPMIKSKPLSFSRPATSSMSTTEPAKITAAQRSGFSMASVLPVKIEPREGPLVASNISVKTEPREGYHSTLLDEISASRPSRLEQARRVKARQESEKEAKRKLDVIPTFL